VLIDFHTHTTASDGALAPGELVERALAAGIARLAITDHDTVAGYRAAAACCARQPVPLQLVSGVEFSCCWSGTTVHIVGLGMDCDHPAMLRGLRAQEQARGERAVIIARRLGALGFSGALAGAEAHAGESQLGRPHFAAWLVASGHVADHNEAFDRYLGQGRTGDVKTFWPTLGEVIGWIADAGGQAVVAHPLKYRFTRMKLRRLVADFIAAGGAAIEILSGRQTAEQSLQLQRLAREFDLEVSVGSDFHRDTPYGPQLGVESPQLRGLRGVWERWALPRHSQEREPA
jgi:predicted metal-dependent phosphoesterase TrpH